MGFGLPEAFEAELYPAVDAELRDAVNRLGVRYYVAAEVLGSFVAKHVTTPISMAYPLLIYGLYSPDLRAAVPVSAIHVLSLAAARFVDDLADGEVFDSYAGLTRDEALLAAVHCAHLLPVRILARLDVGDEVRAALVADLDDGTMVGTEGQLREYRADPASADLDSVMQCYRGKNGSGFAFSGVMAARLAGANPAELGLLRKFGLDLGALRQLRNDEDDLVTGRGQDLSNRVFTYLFAWVLSRASSRERAVLLELHARTPVSSEARDELRKRLLRLDDLQTYLTHVATLPEALHRQLTEFGDRPYLRQLHDVVAESARQHPWLTLAARDRTPIG